MTDPVDRDRQVEHLLRQSMPGGLPASSPCVDAERLAAWSAGSLRREDAAMVERHLADCSDCQLMLAVFVESEPVPSVETAPFWQRWSVRWLVPAAAASAAVLVWTVASYEPADLPDVSTTMARAEPGPGEPPGQSFSVLPAPVPAIEAPLQQANGNGVPSPTPAVRPEAAETRSREVAPDAATVAGPTRDLTAASERQAVAAPAAAPQATAAPEADQRAPMLMAEPPPLRAAQSTLPPPAPPAPPAAPPVEQRFAGRGQNNVMIDGITAMDTAVPQHVRVDASPVQFSSSAQADVRWRIHPDGRLERSSDRGQTWTLIVLQPLTRITAGSAPVADTSWVVGRDGVVFRSNDGTTFTRLSFPVSVDLTTVVAQETAQATVTTADGRVFETSDGGATWQQR